MCAFSAYSWHFLLLLLVKMSWLQWHYRKRCSQTGDVTDIDVSIWRYRDQEYQEQINVSRIVLKYDRLLLYWFECVIRFGSSMQNIWLDLQAHSCWNILEDMFSCTVSIYCVCCISCCTVKCRHSTVGRGNHTFPRRQNSAWQGEQVFSQFTLCTSPLCCCWQVTSWVLTAICADCSWAFLHEIGTFLWFC